MNKYILPFFFTILYLTALFRPLVPIVEYYWDYEYIATVLCENKDKPALKCNGKCHLKKEIKKQQNPTDSKDKPVLIQDIEKYQVAQFFTIKCCNKLIVLDQHFFNMYGNTKVKKYISKIFHPPQYSFNIA